MASKRRKTSCGAGFDCGRPRPAPLVGRSTELTALRSFLRGRCAVSGGRGSMYVCGSTGTGKTAALVQCLGELEEWAAAEANPVGVLASVRRGVPLCGSQP